MKIGILGTGTVGQTLGARLAEAGHHVMIGTRNVKEKLVSDKPDHYGNPPFREWLKAHPAIPLVTYEEAASSGELVINATQGAVSIQALQDAGKNNLINKILVDVANPLDTSSGMPPTLLPQLSNTTSLGEEIQRAFPEAKVVKTLNTMWTGLMVNPAMINHGDHTNFICGNDADAKLKVTKLLKEMGWKDECIMDIGDISSSRGTEAYLPVWLRIMNSKKSAVFNLKIVD